MSRTMLLIVLSALAVGAAAEPLRWEAEDTPAGFLARVERAGEGLEPGPRLAAAGAEAVVLGAVSAQSLGGNAPAEWGPKLFSEGTDGAELGDGLSVA